MPGLSFSKVIDLLVARFRGPGAAVTSERVAGVYADGKVALKRSASAPRIPVSGEVRGLRAGDRGHVMWKGRKPELFVRHQARRAQPSDQVVTGGPVVEELWISGAEVWFRNADTTAPLELARFGLAGSLGRVGWGARDDRFFVHHTAVGPLVFFPGIGFSITFLQYVSAFKFDREPGTGLPAGTDPAAAIALEQTYSFSADPFVVATVLGTPLPASTVGNPIVDGLGLTIQDLALDDVGNVIVVFGVGISKTVASEDIDGPGSSTSFALSFTLPVVVDVSRHVVLLDAFVDGAAAWAPIGAGDPFPTDPIPITTGPEYATGWEKVTPAIDTRQRFVLERPLVVDGQLISYIAGMERERFIGAHATVIPSPPFPGFPPSDPPRHRAAFVKPPNDPAIVLVAPGDLESTDVGYRMNETHVLWWRRNTASLGLVGGNLWPVDEAEPAYLTSFAQQTTTEVGSALRRFGDRNVRLLSPSFAWQPAAIPVDAETPTADDERDRFLELWDFDSGVPSIGAGSTEVAADGVLEPAGAMAELGDAPTQGIDVAGLDVHVVNDQAALAAVGRYREPAGTETP